MDGIDATKGLNFGAQFVGSSLYTGLYTKPEGSSGQSFRGFWIPSVRVYVYVCVYRPPSNLGSPYLYGASGISSFYSPSASVNRHFL